MSQVKKAPLKPVFYFAVIFSSILFTSNSYAEALMSKAQFADYSVRYQCAELKFHDDLAKKEQILMALEKDFGINDETFDAFDELIPEFEKDDDLLDSIRDRVQKECS